MKKRILSILLVIVMVFSLLPVTAFATDTTYAITNGTAQADSDKNHGYISIDKETAAKGETVTITVNPADGYQLKSLTVTPVATFKAVYDTNGGANTLTFYYDAVDHSGEGVTVYEGTGLFNTEETTAQKKWGYHGNRSSITSVVIDASVAGYKGLTSTAYMFQGMTAASDISGAEYLDVSNVTDMSLMFMNFGGGSTNSHTTLNSVPDVSKWNTANVTNMTGMFWDYGNFSDNLTKVPDVSKWNTANVTNMAGMFQQYGYSSINFNDVPKVSGWSTGKVEDMSTMFRYYGKNSTALTAVPEVCNWNTAEVKTMAEMFREYGASSTVLKAVPDVSGWNTSNVTTMVNMFQNYGKGSVDFVLDLSGWDLSKITSNKGDNVFDFTPSTFNVTIPATTGAKFNESGKWYYGNGTNSIAPPEGKTFTPLDYVEIGGVKWATKNLGATTPTDYGSYFSWGDITGQAAATSGTGAFATAFSWANCPFNNGSSSYNGTYFSSVKETVCPGGVLKNDYDVANKVLGGDWRMPTEAEFKALITSSTKSWQTNYNESGVNGYLYTGANGNSIFLPAAGCGNGTDLEDLGSDGYYWSSSLDTGVPQVAYFLYLGEYDTSMDRWERIYGFSVRPVKDEAPAIKQLKSPSPKLLKTSAPVDPETITPEKQQNGTYQFTMPAAAVTVTATFEETTGITTWSALLNAITVAPGSGEVPATATTTIQLTGDLTAPEQDGASITIPNGKDITLDLNGYVINANGGAFSVIKVETGGKLTLIDSKPETEHYFTVGNDGLWTLTNTQTDKTQTVIGGVITGGSNAETSGGGAVFVNQGGAFTMNGGNLVGNKATSGGGAGGGVYNGGTFTMNDGEISGNKATYNGGGVYNGGTFTMNDGEISGNKACDGGGVFNGGTFTMNDGEISGNKANYGGGIENGGKLYLTAGQSGEIIITDNGAAACGGVDNWKEMHLSGKVIIKDNTKTLNSRPTNIGTTNPITIDDALTGSVIYVSHRDSEWYSCNPGVLTFGFAENNTGAKVGDFFHYDGPSTYYMDLNADGANEGELEVKAVPDDSYAISIPATVGGVVTADKQIAANGNTVTITVTPNKGYQLKSLKYNDGTTDHEITKDATSGLYQFTMPAKAVTVTAEFAPKLTAPQIPTVAEENVKALMCDTYTNNLGWWPQGWGGCNWSDKTISDVKFKYANTMAWDTFAGNWQNTGVAAYANLHFDIWFAEDGNAPVVKLEFNGSDPTGEITIPGTFKAGWNSVNINVENTFGEQPMDNLKALTVKVTKEGGPVAWANILFFNGEYTSIDVPTYNYTEYENWQIKYENSGGWTGNLERVEDGLYKIEILWDGTGFNVQSDTNPIKKDWYAPEDLTIGDEVIAPVNVDVYLKVIDDETVMIGVGVEPEVPDPNWPKGAPTVAPAAPTVDGASIIGAALTTDYAFEPLDWPGAMPVKLTFATGETIYYMSQMTWQQYTNWDQDFYDMSEYGTLHIDLFPATGTEIKVTFEGLSVADGGQGYEDSVVKTLTAGQWNSLDIALSEFPALSSGDAYDFTDIRYFILGGYNAEQTALSVGNVYFYGATDPVFDACGGTDAVWDSDKKTVSTPTFGDYVFAGWYTAPVGGNKVESDFAAGTTYYAHWTNADGNIVLTEGIEVKADGVYIGSTLATNEQLAPYGLAFTAATDSAPATLSMNGVTIESGDGIYTGWQINDEEAYAGIYSELAIELKLTGDNKVSIARNDMEIAPQGGFFHESLIVTGDGTLTFDANDSKGCILTGLYVYGNLTNSAVLTADASGAEGTKVCGMIVNGLLTNSATITGKGGKATSESYGVQVKDLLNTAGTLTGIAGSGTYADGLASFYGMTCSINITGGKVVGYGGTGTNEYYGLWTGSDITVSGTGILEVHGGTKDSAKQAALFLEDNTKTITISDSGKIVADSAVKNDGKYADAYTVTGANAAVTSTSANSTLTKSGTADIVIYLAAPAPNVTAANATVTASSVTLPYDATYEYKVDDGKWQSGTGKNVFAGLEPATQYTFKVRVMGTETEMPSNEATITLYTAQAALEKAENGYELDYITEELSVADACEVSTKNGTGSGNTFEDGIVCVANSFKPTPGTTYYIRIRSTPGGAPASEAVSFTVPARPATPESAPVLDSKTDTTITVTAVEGQEYSADGGTTWVSQAVGGKVTITGLTANTAYNVVARVKAIGFEGSEAFASLSSPALSVTTMTSGASAPSVTAADVTVTKNTITLPYDESYEYKFDDGEWKNGEGTNVLGELEEGSEHTVKIRIKGTESVMPSAETELTVYTLPAAPVSGEDYVIDYAAETITIGNGYEISTKNGTGSGNTFADGKLTPDGSKQVNVLPGTTYYIRKAAVSGGAPASEAVSFTVPARPAAPENAPVLDSKTDTTITVTAVEGQEYSIDNGEHWVSGTNGKVTFTGLSANNAYSIVTRVKAVTTEGSEKFASANSTASVITTKSTEQSAAAAEPVDVSGGEIKSGDTVVDVKGADGEAVASEDLAAVAEAINKVLDNDKVNNFGQITDETGLITATSTDASKSAIVAALKEQTEDTDEKDMVDENEKDISKYLNVTLVSADVDTTEDVVVTAMVFDVTPMAAITVTGSNGEVTLTTEIENDEIDGTVTFLLPVDKSIKAETAAVYHEGKFLDNDEIETDGSGNKYIEVKTDSFSKFGYITLDDATAGAKIDSTYYASLSDAVSKVANDQTITLLKDASGTITVSRNVKFTVDENGKTNSAEITAGSGYTVSKSGSIYTVTKIYYDDSYSVELPENVKNGKVEVSPKNASAGQTVTLTVTPDKGFTLETLTVLDKNGKEVEVKNLGNNKFSFKMPSGKVSISATFMEDNSMLNFFVDVKADDYYYDAVLWAAENGITNGVDAVHFGPEIGVTRAQVVTFLWRVAGCPEPVGNSAKFTDLLADQYYIKAVAWAIEQGITKGVTDTTFEPEMVCTRGQIVTFLARFAGVEDADTESVFTDVPANEFFAAAVKWAKDNGVTSGVTDTTFEPYTNCNRAQVVTFLYRWMVK